MDDGQEQLIQSLIRLLAGDGEFELEGVTFTAKELTLSLSGCQGPGVSRRLCRPDRYQAGLVDVGYTASGPDIPGKDTERLFLVQPGATVGAGSDRLP